MNGTIKHTKDSKKEGNEWGLANIICYQTL